jgi:hypothetical protein
MPPAAAVQQALSSDVSDRETGNFLRLFVLAKLK